MYIVLLRHPLGSAHRCWLNDNQCRIDCCLRRTEHWLRQHDALLKDIPQLNNAVVVQYEHLMQGDTEAMLQALLSHIGLNETHIHVPISSQLNSSEYSIVEKPWLPADAVRKQGSGRKSLEGQGMETIDEFTTTSLLSSPKSRRKLLELHGHRHVPVPRPLQ